MAGLELDISNFDDVIEAAQNFSNNALALINDIIHKEAGDLIRSEIQPLIPASGRTWSGKKAAASSTNPFASDKTSEMLAVTVHTRSAYHYLYFPDDGSTTERHYGNQQFFKRGGEAATPDIIELCIGRLTEEFNGD